MCGLSIITVCCNSYKELKKTFDSTLLQKDYFPMKIEYIVVDNNSSDGTSSLVNSYSRLFIDKGFEFTYIRESDNGIYDAMNKGIREAKLQWLMLLNAGDTFFDDTVLEKIKNHMEDDAEVLVGSYNRKNPSGDIIVAPPKIERLKSRMIFCHQAIVIRRNTHLDFLYNQKYKIVADYDALLRMYLSGVSFKYIDCCVVNYDVTGLSAKRMTDTHKEMYAVRRNNQVIDKKVKEELIFVYGLMKRTILAKIPPKVRWPIVGFWNRHFGKKYI